jgi:poly(beta-D-mannuronate) lyase
MFPPVRTLELVGIYTDARQSVPNPDAERRNTEMTASVDSFMRFLEKAVDNPAARPGDPAADCAYDNLRQWARDGALTVDPPQFNRDGLVKRQEYLVGLDILALKFQAAHFPQDPAIVSWLRQLTYKYIDYYARATNRGNLYVWSGAAAALFALFDHDRRAIDYQNQVWQSALMAIRGDGLIDAELARGQRALIYHMFSFSAVSTLRAAREAFGYPTSPAEKARLKLLSDAIGHSLCSPDWMAQRAQAKQETPGDWAYRLPIGLGGDLLNQDWSQCGRPNADVSDPTSGGDTRHTAAVLKAMAGQSGRPRS